MHEILVKQIVQAARGGSCVTVFVDRGSRPQPLLSRILGEFQSEEITHVWREGDDPCFYVKASNGSEEPRVQVVVPGSNGGGNGLSTDHIYVPLNMHTCGMFERNKGGRDGLVVGYEPS